jgi:hypothetical protein
VPTLKCTDMHKKLFELLYIHLYTSSVDTLYMFYSGPTRCTLYSLFLSSLALHVSGAICPIISSTTAAYSHRLCMVWCVIPLEQYWFGTPLHLSMVSFRLSQTSTCSSAITHHNHTHTYGCMLQLCCWWWVHIAPKTCRANDERNQEYSVHLFGPE